MEIGLSLRVHSQTMTVMESLKLQISIDLAFGDKVSCSVRIDGDVVLHSHESSGFQTPDLNVNH